MPSDTLECPSTASELYLVAPPDEVPITRPVMTGDIFADVDIPGVDNTGLGVVLTHPCSMRSDGVNLVPKLLVARVIEYSSVPFQEWKSGHFKIMPFPELDGKSHAAKFDDMGLVQSSVTKPSSRIASLDLFGVNLLQQRFIWYLTRFRASTSQLAEVTLPVFEEADLCEEWVTAAVVNGDSAESAALAFHDRLTTKNDLGETPQQMLSEPQRIAGVRREMKRFMTADSV